MPFNDIPKDSPYIRYFFNGAAKNLFFASHGAWLPQLDGMTRLKYTYHFFSQTGATLSGAQYKSALANLKTEDPVDILGPGSGSVANLRLTPLQADIFYFTAKAFTSQTKPANPMGLGLLAYHINPTCPAMTLALLDGQLLPALKIPTSMPIRMIVCRGLMLNHVTPVVRLAPTVIGDPILVPSGEHPPADVFGSITNDML